MSAASREIIEECRRNHEAARAGGFKPEIESAQSAREKEIFQKGRTVWGATVKANEALFHVGKIDLRGCIVVSLDPYFDENSRILTEIAQTAFALRTAAAADPEIKAFAALVLDDLSNFANKTVPRSLTSGRLVRYETVQFWRTRLPTGFLADRRYPVVADSAGVMILPLKYWSQRLIQHWENLGGDKIRQAKADEALAVQESTSLARNTASPVTLTAATARELKKIISQQKLKKAALRVGEEHGAFSMQLTEAPANPASEISYDSQGITLVIERRCVKNLMGLEIDFVAASPRGGFTFNQKRAHQ